MAPRTDALDLAPLKLVPGEGRRLELEVSLDDLTFGEDTYRAEPSTISVTLDLSRMTGGGWALRLRFSASLLGPCMRCLEPASPTTSVDTREVDASLLVIPLVGFLPGDDPRVLGTIEAVEKELIRDGLVMRYRTETGVDGLQGDEHPFVACSFWLVSAYAKAGRVDDAHALMRRLVKLCNDVGLLSEEYDPHRQRMVGNFPQAFSHLALVGAAFGLSQVDRDSDNDPGMTTSGGRAFTTNE